MILPRIGNYHAVTPGPDSPEPACYPQPGLAGLRAALTAAMRAPRDGVPRVITAVRGRTVTYLCTVTDGVAAWPPGREIVPARKTPRKSRKERS